MLLAAMLFSTAASAGVLDFTAKVDDSETAFSALKIDDEPHDSLGALYRAKWLGNPYS